MAAAKTTPRTRRRTTAKPAEVDVGREPVRYMTVVAQDPSLTHGGKIIMAKVALPAEDLSAGPIGYRLQLVDYDASSSRFFGSHELPATFADEPAAWRNGDPSIVADYRFHAQNTYALVMKTLSRFEFALGRRLSWSFRPHQLKIAPHGMYDANAFYSPEQEGLVFGYFTGRSGKPVYTCLSHDIIVHETTHALIDALRERYMDPSNPDQAALHEGFADVIALLSVFSLPEVVTHLLQPSAVGSHTSSLIARDRVSTEALCQSALFGLAEQMGDEIESIRGAALRQSAQIKSDPTLKDQAEFLESHRRGELFVAAVIKGFIEAWSDRILSSGTPGQQQFPVARVAEEGADIADKLATMWIRALDYMPPVHVEFGDALSAALTSDLQVRPDDSRYELRSHMLKHFRAYGFEPTSKRTNPVGTWDPPPSGLRYDRVRFDSMRTDPDEVFQFIWDNRQTLKIRDGAYTEVLSVRPCTRIGIDGFVVRETVAEYYQVARLTADEMEDIGVRAPKEYLAELRAQAAAQLADAAATTRAGRGERPVVEEAHADQEAEAGRDAETDGAVTPLYGGGVLIFDEYGRVKYWIYNDIFGRQQNERLQYLWDQGHLRVGRGGSRMRARRLSTLHRLRAMEVRTSPAEAW